MALIQCKGCGSMISDQASVCPKCGTPVSQSSLGGQQPAYQQVAPAHQPYASTNAEDTSSIALNVLSFLFPVVGWVLWGMYKATSPIRAKACSKWAWIGFGITCLFYLLCGLAEY